MKPRKQRFAHMSQLFATLAALVVTLAASPKGRWG